ncbi:glycoside hydrolase family 32 protein [Cellulophaga baltica]|uniref:glycoside hydrolase family 32 protein n=1 Tax=Cellulophaga baltica TaxID=76594 RepID=UPI002494257D|nr:glycoside hydrolase family 32 protein [Cellulophaga baltica]
MKVIIRCLFSFMGLVFLLSCQSKEKKNKVKEESIGATEVAILPNTEAYRPQYHFTPPEKWMNDPNGLVYHQGIYHLFYQYYPDDIVWGPMHWGHATSKDLLHWKHKPIALFPDKNGYIFSGSAVIDTENTSGFGTKENPPLVAIFTYHDIDGEKAGKTDFQTQGIAYSLDNGETFTVYEGNPVIGNDGIKDFRDPKVFWNEKANNWTMLLVAGDHLQIWQSDTLISWKKVSEFGKNQGAHGGVWECPDLFPLKVAGEAKEKWVLLISINPGAPNGGSGTQYFIGDFDGTTFTSTQEEDRWLDWGTDNYAGVTYNNTPDGKRIFIGWMSNWSYARDTPTEKWRSAMTIPRELSLEKINEQYELINYPITGLKKVLKSSNSFKANPIYSVAGLNISQSEIVFTTASRDFELSFTNQKEDRLKLLFDGANKQVVLDRATSGKTDFQEDFAKENQLMPIKNLPEGAVEVRILMDWSSIEVFINKGQYVMTSQIFPNEHYTNLNFHQRGEEPVEVNKLEIREIESVW